MGWDGEWVRVLPGLGSFVSRCLIVEMQQRGTVLLEKPKSRSALRAGLIPVLKVASAGMSDII